MNLNLPNIKRFIKKLRQAGYGNEALLLFTAFARFEYSLKRSGYVTGSGRTKTCVADWDTFASDNEDSFSHAHADGLKDAKAYFDERPPHKQVFLDGKMKWKKTERSGEGDLLWYSILVRRVRNNLFHGEKTNAFLRVGVNEPEEPEPSRNLLLLRHTLVMLEAFIECNENVKQWFHESMPGV